MFFLHAFFLVGVLCSKDGPKCSFWKVVISRFFVVVLWGRHSPDGLGITERVLATSNRERILILVTYSVAVWPVFLGLGHILLYKRNMGSSLL